MHAVRLLAEAAAWAVVGLTTVLLITQAIGWSKSMLVAVAQALTVVIAGLCALVAIFGRVWSNWPLTIAALVVAAASVVVIAPALRRRHPPSGDPWVSVLHANLLYENTRRNAALAAAVLGQGADVLALSELHPRHEAALLADPGSAQYPYRVQRARDERRRDAAVESLPVRRCRVADDGLAPVGDRHRLPAWRWRAARRARPQQPADDAPRAARLGAVDGGRPRRGDQPRPADDDRRRPQRRPLAPALSSTARPWLARCP